MKNSAYPLTSVDNPPPHFYKKILIPPSSIFQKSQPPYKQGRVHTMNDQQKYNISIRKSISLTINKQLITEVPRLSGVL